MPLIFVQYSSILLTIVWHNPYNNDSPHLFKAACVERACAPLDVVPA